MKVEIDKIKSKMKPFERKTLHKVTMTSALGIKIDEEKLKRKFT